MKTCFFLWCALSAPILSAALQLTEADRAKVVARVDVIRTWAATPLLVEAVASRNASGLGEYEAMTQEQWKTLAVRDPKVQAFTQGPLADQLRQFKTSFPAVTEIFINAADGTKVAFLSKPTNWSHRGKPKHEQPLSGQVWIGDPERDESTRMVQIQIAVPVLQDGSPIGSIVVGLSLADILN